MKLIKLEVRTHKAQEEHEQMAHVKDFEILVRVILFRAALHL